MTKRRKHLFFSRLARGRRLLSPKGNPKGWGVLLIGAVLFPALWLGFYFFAAPRIQWGEGSLQDAINRLTGDWGVTVAAISTKIWSFISMFLAWLDETSGDVLPDGIVNVTPPPGYEVPVYIIVTFSVRCYNELVRNGIVEEGPVYAWYQLGPVGWWYMAQYYWKYEFWNRTLISAKEGDITVTVTANYTPPEGLQQARDTNGNPISNVFTVGLPSVNASDFLSYSEVDVNIDVSERDNPTNSLFALNARIRVPVGTSVFSYVFNVSSSVFMAHSWVAKVACEGHEHRYRYVQVFANVYGPYGNYLYSYWGEVEGQRYVVVKQGKVYETTIVVA